MQALSTILNTRFWLMAMGAFLTAFTAFALSSGQAASGAPGFWGGDLTEKELNIAIVVEVVWFAHMLGMGVMIFAIGLFVADPIRARVGAIAVIAIMGTQFIAAGMASSYGYNGFSGFYNLLGIVHTITSLQGYGCLELI